ncbi:putative T7SS-secreted protein [Amycolatopsis viridis]|uniref:Putative T7SS secretion signal domain-containing protein n=1 Tax=Amycolatopsis viridis TaxID=185678 RepID=A0ABX0SQU5_9PSEU|nr:hypothetical protein [Amycolatopsis viridis]NIH77736.1 hypothetical protein [Amycolatopsis viridis]
MSAELGSTKDPRELIPGSPETIAEHVRTLLDQAEQFDGMGSKLSGFRVPGWQGAASNAFGELIQWLPPQWLKASDSLSTVADGLSAYADTLHWAQRQAGEAIATWDEGKRAQEQAAVQAAAGGTEDTQQQAEQKRAQGDLLQQVAQEILDRAREQLDRQAGDLMRMLGTVEAAAGTAIGGLLHAITSPEDDEFGSKYIPPEHGKLSRYRYYAYLLHQVSDGTVTAGDLTLTGKLETMIGSENNFQAALNKKGLTLELESINGFKTTATGRVDTGVLGLDGKAEGTFGVRGRAGVRITKTALDAKGGVFAGARGSLRGAADVGGVGVGTTAEGWAGFGAEAGFNVGMGDDGKFHLKGNVGAAVGLGGELGFDLQVDGHKVAQTAKSATHAIGNGVEAVSEGVKDFGEGVSHVGQSLKGLFG